MSPENELNKPILSGDEHAEELHAIVNNAEQLIDAEYSNPDMNPPNSWRECYESIFFTIGMYLFHGELQHKLPAEVLEAKRARFSAMKEDVEQRRKQYPNRARDIPEEERRALLDGLLELNHI